MTGPAESEYQSYLLRLWRSGDGSGWRVMLEQIGSHQRHGFADLESLCAFLRAQADLVDRSAAPPPEETDILQG